jgi:nucleotide-binding universal stress UspA family protein
MQIIQIMENIIVATDFSIKSYNALIVAKKIARKANSTIHIVHVIEPVHGKYSIMGEYVDDPMDDLFMVKLVEKVTEELKILKNSHTESSFEIETKLVVGHPYSEIKILTKSLNAQLLIMGTQGVTDTEEFFLGSLTDKLIRTSLCPVIAVTEVINEEQFDNIVYATNLKEDDKQMMNLMLAFQGLFKSTIHLLNVNTTKNFKNDIDTKVTLQKLVDRYEMKNYTLNCYSHEDEEYGIVYFADEVGADLIAMGVHEKSGFRRLISGGSVVDDVKDHTFRPVLTHRFQSEKVLDINIV